jgi:aspartate carbamoyltransferase catalytic subunit
MQHLISMHDLGREDVLGYLEAASRIERGETIPEMGNRLAALLFFEPSTRTRFSFDAAMKRMGGRTLFMDGTTSTSAKKGESFADTLMTISMYADLMVIRSPMEGAARFAAETVDIPVINAGDGANQHPTQALLDLYSVRKTQDGLENLTIGLIGDLKFGRTVHSLVQALSSFSPTFYFVSPPHLRMPRHICAELLARGGRYTEVEDPEPVIGELDLMYVTRIQRERFADPEDYERVKDSYVINAAMLEGVKSNFKVFHPLPRVGEISTDVDHTPHAYYFQQAKNGVVMRQAIISTLLGGVS